MKVPQRVSNFDSPQPYRAIGELCSSTSRPFGQIGHGRDLDRFSAALKPGAQGGAVTQVIE